MNLTEDPGFATLTHCILNRLSHTIYWKSPISVLGMSGYEIYIFLGGAHSITTVHTSVRPVFNTNGFRAISFEKIGVLD